MKKPFRLFAPAILLCLAATTVRAAEPDYYPNCAKGYEWKLHEELWIPGGATFDFFKGYIWQIETGGYAAAGAAVKTVFMPLIGPYLILKDLSSPVADGVIEIMDKYRQHKYGNTLQLLTFLNMIDDAQKDPSGQTANPYDDFITHDIFLELAKDFGVDADRYPSFVNALIRAFNEDVAFCGNNRAHNAELYTIEEIANNLKNTRSFMRAF